MESKLSDGTQIDESIPVKLPGNYPNAHTSIGMVNSTGEPPSYPDIEPYKYMESLSYSNSQPPGISNAVNDSYTEEGVEGTRVIDETHIHQEYLPTHVPHAEYMQPYGTEFDLSHNGTNTYGALVTDGIGLGMSVSDPLGVDMGHLKENVKGRHPMYPAAMRMQSHDGMPLLHADSLEQHRRSIGKGRKNKSEANELVRRAKQLPKVMGVRYDANHQYWVATWYQNRKRMDRYFSVGRFGFEEARLLAIDCRKTAGKSLQGKSYDKQMSNEKHMKVVDMYGEEFAANNLSVVAGMPMGYMDPVHMQHMDSDKLNSDKGEEYADGDMKHRIQYRGGDPNKKSKDFNRLNVSKVALNYILSDLCNNCLPTILENNHMPGELYIHCYNKISDHLQMIITASQSEDIEKYLHLFQLCIQNRVLPSALQVQEQRAMITRLCQI
ncbi:hypothetical protein BmR1_04g06770 [Babesia microti strain RI]|uniref:AP2/ERF domain-containing protein n=1 Tax=Babesia microti (strain RI) TaxID=1133968 RepID=I7JD10_BABMR|nr:hypothetical protein BmR1_04g06770 [Babesia microti strain RI]CCF75550.1 hypothetical protein BmR1_04g06770 [Babesia microti strain RI]|eukprot:XP_012649958.1 hypothetical protein BmR1_04g06770 [Babesia microti strain RI]